VVPANTAAFPCLFPVNLPLPAPPGDGDPGEREPVGQLRQLGGDAEFPQEEFYGRTLEEAPAWCPVWLMAPEIGTGPFRVSVPPPPADWKRREDAALEVAPVAPKR
jgi:hypothetical protein